MRAKSWNKVQSCGPELREFGQRRITTMAEDDAFVTGCEQAVRKDHEFFAGGSGRDPGHVLFRLAQ